MDRVRYGLALLLLMMMPGALLYWFSIHPFVRFWRGVGVRATVTIHHIMIAAVGCGMYLLRGRLLSVEYGTSPLLMAISVPALMVSLVMRSEERRVGREARCR